MTDTSANNARQGPLAGIRIIDTTSVLFGPYCTQLLGDMGADVIKVEGLDGDTMRGAGAGSSPGMSGVFVSTNRNKRSIAVDMKAPEGKQIVLNLLKNADIFVTNIRRKAVARLGLDYATLVEDNPGLIYCSAVGFGEGGPYEDMPAFDDTIQAISGLASLQEAISGTPGYVGTAVADKISGLTLALAIVAAVRHRDVTGGGQHIEVPMFETMVAFNMLEHLAGHTFDPPLGPTLYPRTVSKHRKPYKTSDGYLAVMPYNNGQWERFFKLIGKPELATNPRFHSMTTRTKNVDELYGLLAEEVSQRSTAWWLEALRREDIPVVPVKSADDLLRDEHLLARGFIKRFEHATEGTVVAMAPPIEMSSSPLSIRRLAPRLGGNTREILQELGYDEERITALFQERVVGTPSS